jgi:hypothetical protein
MVEKLAPLTGKDPVAKSSVLPGRPNVRLNGRRSSTTSAITSTCPTTSGTCGAHKFPAISWVAGVYVRDGGHWKAAFHAEAPVVDPSAASARSVNEHEARKDETASPTDRTAEGDALLARENVVWEAWRIHDANEIAKLMAKDISFINIFGMHFSNKADALTNWSGTGCDVKSVRIADARTTALSPTVAILTFKAAADGTCYGQKVGPVWGTSIYVRDGNDWVWNFGINLPARSSMPGST